jgi:uncharacterized protein (TIGR00369 family)
MARVSTAVFDRVSALCDNSRMDTASSRLPREGWREYFDAFPFHRYLGLTLEEERPGFARVAMTTGPNTLGGVAGSVHGGILAALVDIAMLRAVVPLFGPDDEPGGTVDLSVTYLRPALGERIVAEASVLRRGRQIAVTEVSILDAQGKLCAKGRVLYAFRPKG